MKHWRPDEMAVMAGMRARFLDGTAGVADYWKSREELRLYDMTFAERIGWKIDAALRALDGIGWRPAVRRLIDWGCGTGIGARKMAQAFDSFERVAFADRSAAAVAFAKERFRERHPGIQIEEPEVTEEALVLLSHVANELSPQAVENVIAMIRNAGEVLWVDAGTQEASRKLIQIRERILAMEDAPAVVGPCPHARRCGLLAEGNARHWCHFFAEIPSAVFQDARWAEWSRELGIDLRGLSYSWLAFSRRASFEMRGRSRVIGVPREAKGYCKVLACGETGVAEWMLQKRDAPGLYRRLTRDKEFGLQMWRAREGRILAEDEKSPE
jgi:ribosomal protein RSM22 (predicted rRNA methylase)